MNWSDIKEKAAMAAPLLGTLLGGPAGASVGGMVASALGVSGNPKAVLDALSQPKNVTQLRKWTMQHKERLEQLALDTLEAELKDKANARAAHKGSYMPAAITVLMTSIVGGLLFMLFSVELPASNREVAFMLFGQASALWGASVTYWVGTTRSSAEKNKIIGSV